MCFFRDRVTGNDAVGTTYLNLAKIASSGGEIEGIYNFRIKLEKQPSFVIDVPECVSSKYLVLFPYELTSDLEFELSVFLPK